MFTACEENGSPYPPNGSRDDSASTTLKALFALEEELQGRGQEEIHRAEAEAAASARRALDEREWEARWLREAAELERAHDAMPAQAATHEGESVAADADAPAEKKDAQAQRLESSGLDRESGPHNKAIAVLIGAALAMALLTLGHLLLLQPRIAHLTDASLRALKERGAMREQMERVVADERSKAAALAIDLANVREVNVRLERELAAARQEHPAHMPNMPALIVPAPPSVTPRASAAAVDAKASPPTTKRADPQEEGPCHPGDPLCSSL